MVDIHKPTNITRGPTLCNLFRRGVSPPHPVSFSPAGPKGVALNCPWTHGNGISDITWPEVTFIDAMVNLSTPWDCWDIPGLVNVNKKRTGKIHHFIASIPSTISTGPCSVATCKRLPEGNPYKSYNYGEIYQLLAGTLSSKHLKCPHSGTFLC